MDRTSLKITRLFFMTMVLLLAIVLPGNWMAVNVQGADTEPPSFGVPENDELTTGDEVFFRVDITDNEGLDAISFKYELDGGNEVELPIPPENHTGNLWFLNLRIPDDADTMSYYFWANDTSGNENECSHVGPLLVIDNDLPVFGEDKTTGTPTTGDPFTFIMNCSDNIGVDHAYLVCSFDEDPESSTEMTLDSSDYKKTMDIPAGAALLEYTFKITDAGGNWRNESQPEMDVVDNDVPVLDSHTPGTPETGEDYIVSVIIDDNIGLCHFFVNHSCHEGVCISERMQHTGGTFWSGTISIPENATELEYHFYAMDDADNRLTTADAGIQLDVEDIISPVADAGEGATMVQGAKFDFDATLSSDNIGIESYKWAFTYDGTAKELTGASTSFTFVEAGTYEVLLTVADAAGNEGTDNITIVVRDSEDPVAKAGKDITVDQHEDVDFDGTDSVDNGGIKVYSWTFIYDGNQKILFGEEATFTFDLAGTYDVTLNVTDHDRNWHTDDLVVTVLDITAPTAIAGGDRSCIPGDIVVLNGSSSIDNVAITTYLWTFEYGGMGKSLSGKDNEYTFEELGDYNITLTVTDEAGNTGTDSFTLSVAEALDETSPKGKISIAGDYDETGGRYEVMEGNTVTFNASGSTDNMGIVSYRWVITFEQNDTELEGSSVEYIFPETGKYVINLIVTDSGGNTDTKTLYFNVKEKAAVVSSSGGDDGVPGWVIFILVIGVLGAILMVYLIFLIVKKNKEAEAERDIELAPPEEEPVPEAQPVVETHEIAPPESEYIPPGQGPVAAPQLPSVEKPDVMQIAGPSETQQRLPPGPAPVCPGCGAASVFYSEYSCYWCEPCQDYVYLEGQEPGASQDTASAKTVQKVAMKPVQTAAVPASATEQPAQKVVAKPVPTAAVPASATAQPAQKVVAKPVPTGAVPASATAQPVQKVVAKPRTAAVPASATAQKVVVKPVQPATAATTETTAAPTASEPAQTDAGEQTAGDETATAVETSTEEKSGEISTDSKLASW